MLTEKSRSKKIKKDQLPLIINERQNKIKIKICRKYSGPAAAAAA